MHGTLERTDEEEKLKLENELSLQKYMVKEGRVRYNKLKVRNDDVEASVKMWRSDSLISENKSKRLQSKLDRIGELIVDIDVPDAIKHPEEYTDVSAVCENLYTKIKEVLEEAT